MMMLANHPSKDETGRDHRDRAAEICRYPPVLAAVAASSRPRRTDEKSETASLAR